MFYTYKAKILEENLTFHTVSTSWRTFQELLENAFNPVTSFFYLFLRLSQGKSNMIFSAFTSAAELNKFGASCKIVADINAIKQVGEEGLGSNDDGKELKPGVYGIGALAIGKLKIKTETEMIKRATAEPQGLFDYSIAYVIAKDAIMKKPAKAAAK